MAWSNSLRLICMLTFTFGFFVVELVVSQITGSLTLLADSFHMLSDVIAQIVALFAMRLAGRTQSTDRNTYGWVRAEVMGALVNAVFLYALCATIVMEATERIFEPHEIDNPPLLLAVGILGLLVNLIGIFLFRHGGHSHSHGGHSHGNKNKSKKDNRLTGKETKALSPYADKDNVSQGSGTAQLNIRGVFLHVLGDFMVSVVVVFNALIFTYVWQPCVEGEDCINPCYSGHDGHSTTGHNGTLHLGPFTKMAGPCWVLYMEPCLVFITVGLMLYFTYPLLKEAMLILLQTVPKQIDVNGLNERLLGLDGVLAIHELHIWQLAGSRVIATAHVKCHDPSSYMDVAKRIKDFFHHEGIHATTIQPEFVTFNSESRDCELPCQTQCAPSLCCSNGENGAEQDAAQEP